ncbi:MAG TPA: hypothetical protein VHU90_04815 [Galbitalea sp.]|nr:hypothetical protein [Galbitalea sp.]
MPELEPRDRFLGGVAGEPGPGPEDPAVVDFGDVIRKLILFDEIVVESHNLKEFGPLAQKFGYDGLKAMLESRRLRFVKDMALVADMGQAPMPHRRTCLPAGSYAIHAVWARPPREVLSRQLHKVDAVPGLTSKQAQKLRQLAGACLLPAHEDVLQSAQEQISRDFEANPSGLKVAIALALKREFELELSPSLLELRMEPLGHREWRADTNLPDLTSLTAQQLHDVVGHGLAGAAGLNVRLALMRGFSALTGFQVNDLPLFEEKMEFVTRQIDPDLQHKRFDRVSEIVGLPDVSGDPSVHDVDVEKLLEITQGSEVHDFRRWLRTSSAMTDEEMASLVHPVRDAVGKAVRGPLAKAVRLATTTGVGLVVPPAGVALSALDTFLVDKVMPHPGPTAFLTRLARSVFNA